MSRTVGGEKGWVTRADRHLEVRKAELRVRVAGGELYAEEHGAGEPLILIAGLGQALWIWRWSLPALAQHRRVLVYDARGTGRSTAPLEPCTVDAMAEDAEAVLQAAGVTRADVLGFSMGGYVALTLALAQPARVRSLVLAGTGAGGPGRVPRPPEVRAAFAEAWGLEPAEFGRRTLPHALAPGWPERNPERIEEILAARLERPTSYEAISAHAEACYGFYRAGVEVERIQAPALVVHGDADRIIPVENGRMLASRLPSAEYVELPGRGHDLMLEDPEAFSRAVLDRCRPSRP